MKKNAKKFNAKGKSDRAKDKARTLERKNSRDNKYRFCYQ